MRSLWDIFGPFILFLIGLWLLLTVLGAMGINLNVSEVPAEFQTCGMSGQC